jgi:ribonuclease P protein component
VSGDHGPAQIGRLVRSVDFERVLRQRSRVQGPHFALHHLVGVPSRSLCQNAGLPNHKLSTADETMLVRSVDDSPERVGDMLLPSPRAATEMRLWFGAVVPKRHARRAVTRTLLKRQIRSAVEAHAASLPEGLWVVRLRAGFDRASFPSAASQALRHGARAELDGLLERCLPLLKASESESIHKDPLHGR